MDLTRITRKPVYLDLGALLEGADPGAIISAAIALLPTHTDPDASTVWTSVAYANPTASFVIAGPDTGDPGDVVVPGTCDLWVRATAPTWVDAVLVERINVLSDTALGGLPAGTVSDAYVAGLVGGDTATRDALDATVDAIVAGKVPGPSSTATALRAAWGLREFRVDDYGADPTGAADSTAAFRAALAAMPPLTVWADPVASTGATAILPVGTLRLGAGRYKLGSAGQDVGNIGPFVNVLGSGRNTSTLAYYGTGDCLRVYNPVAPASDTFNHLAAFHGVIDGFTIDGASAGVGARGLHYGDTEGGVLGPDLMVRDFAEGQMLPVGTITGTPSTTGGTLAAQFWQWRVTATNASGETSSASIYSTTTTTATSSVALSWAAVANATGYNVYRSASGGSQGRLVASVTGTSYTDTGAVAINSANPLPPTANVTGSIGLLLDNSVSWTENIWGRVSLYNCDNCVVITRTTAPPADWSFEYNDLTLKVYCFPQQNGVVITGGAGYDNGRMVIRGNMAEHSATQYNALLTIMGTSAADGTGVVSVMRGCRLDVQAETNLGGGFRPRTILLANPFTNGNAILQCTGVLRFFHFWTASNWTSASSINSPNFQFSGIISGDANLHTSGVAQAASAPALTVAGAIGYGPCVGFYSGSTLTFQMQIGDVLTGTLTTNTTIAFTQTLTGPQRKTVILKQDATGGRTVAWPAAVKWPGGVAPTMTAAANATDVYQLVTADGTTWYGRSDQALA